MCGYVEQIRLTRSRAAGSGGLALRARAVSRCGLGPARAAARAGDAAWAGW